MRRYLHSGDEGRRVVELRQFIQPSTSLDGTDIACPGSSGFSIRGSSGSESLLSTRIPSFENGSTTFTRSPNSAHVQVPTLVHIQLIEFRLHETHEFLLGNLSIFVLVHEEQKALTSGAPAQFVYH
jgi:hypothetical protein